MPEFFKGVAQYKRNSVFHIDAISESNEEKAKIIIPLKYSKKCIHGDTVLVKRSSTNTAFGYIQKVIERNSAPITGKLEKKGKFGFVKPLNENYPVTFFVDLNAFEQENSVLADGDIVEISVVDWKESDKNPVGKILKKLITINSDQEIVYSQSLPVKFPTPVIDYCNELNSSNSYIGEDLTRLQNFAIKNHCSPYTCTSFSVEHLPTGYNFYVHTADLTAVVSPGSPLDIEAYYRGNTYGLQKSNTPMMPERVLDITSLDGKSTKPRQSITCVIKLNNKFNIEDVKFMKSFVNTAHSISINDANKIINGTSNEEGYASLLLMSSFVKKMKVQVLQRDVLSYMPSEYPDFIWDYNLKKPVGYTIAENSFVNTIRNAEMIVNKFATSFVSNSLLVNEKQSVFCYGIKHLEKASLAKIRIKLNEAGFEWKDEYDYRQNIINILSSKNIVAKSLISNYLNKPDYSLNAFGTSDIGDYYVKYTNPFDRYSDLHSQRVISAVINKKNIYSGDLSNVCEHLNKCLTKKQNTDVVVNTKAISSAYPINNEPITGVIINVTPKGLYVRAHSNIIGYIPADGISYKVGESALVYIKEYKKDKIIMQFV